MSLAAETRILIREKPVSPARLPPPPLGEAQRRASCITAYGLSITERVLLLKAWILPCVLGER